MSEFSAMVVIPEVEVTEKAVRRQFSAEYKRKILLAADACTREGEIGALLRREGLYSSHLAVWRAARERCAIAGLAPKKRGPKAVPPDPRDRKIVERVPYRGHYLREALSDKWRWQFLRKISTVQNVLKRHFESLSASSRGCQSASSPGVNGNPPPF